MKTTLAVLLILGFALNVPGAQLEGQERGNRPDSLAGSLEAMRAEYTEGNWTLGDFTIDPITDAGRVVAMASPQGDIAARLFVRCHGEDWDLYISWNTLITVEPHDVTLRIGSQGIVDTKRWTPSRDGEASFYPEPAEVKDFIEWALLPPRDVLITRTIGEYSREYTAIFPLFGIDRVYERMQAHCNPGGL